LLREILERLVEGKISVDEAEKALRMNTLKRISGIAKLDVSRETRRGVPEITLAEGKSRDDLVKICTRMFDKTGRAIVSRLDQSPSSAL